MYGQKMKILDELIDHLSDSQGGDLKSLLDESRKPKEIEMVSPELGEDPKGLKVESVEIMGKKPSFDDEAQEAMDVASNKGPSIDPEKAKLFQKGFNESGGFVPDKWKKNIKEGLGMKASNDGMSPHDLMGSDELDDDEIAELLKRYT